MKVTELQSRVLSLLLLYTGEIFFRLDLRDFFFCEVAFAHEHCKENLPLVKAVLHGLLTPNSRKLFHLMLKLIF